MVTGKGIKTVGKFIKNHPNSSLSICSRFVPQQLADVSEYSTFFVQRFDREWNVMYLFNTIRKLDAKMMRQIRKKLFAEMKN